uniref:NADH-ubiquinone oxidoreductase chain 2 n=1 Tax=Lentula callani TaxID=1260738 RepID=M4JCH7_9ORTH|nr:NADH dehydrogenase subunit 2 [Lentula callani]AGC22309.1 NADH dehydrogenase subunit 2 [Lentula callani]
MTKNLMKLLFLSTMLVGTILSFSSNSWFGVWMGLEINLLSFIPLLTNNKSMMMNESSIKYFIVQALASTMLLFSILMIQMNHPIGWESDIIASTMITSSLMLKIGAAPFHFWFPEVMMMSSWTNCFILMTMQKIAPMAVMSYCIHMNIFTMTIIILSICVGAVGGINQTSLYQILAYSSISHLGWMISSMLISENMWEMYFMIYSILSAIMIMIFNKTKSSFVTQLFLSNNIKIEIKFMSFITLLSLGGIPPFIGFLPKWMVMQTMIENKLSSIMTIMVMTTLITLYYYMRIGFSALIINYTEMTWTMNKIKVKQNLLFMIMVMTSMMGLIFTSILILN